MDDKPYNYILQCRGKKIRGQLIQAFNHWLNIPDEIRKKIEEIVEMLHNASLLIDDIEDNSVLRRGIPVAHNIFGIGPTINCANYVYFLALEKIIKEFPGDKIAAAVRIFTQQLLELHRGQGMDIYWRESFKCPTEDEYLQMIRMKTGGLFGLGVQLMQLFSEDKRDYSRLVTLLGSYFQIRDDYLNLKSDDYAKNKSFCEDLTEGKFSFPILYGINSKPDDPTLINIVRQRTSDLEIKKFAVELMEKHGCFTYTSNYLRKIHEDSKIEIERLGENPYMTKILELFSNNCTFVYNICDKSNDSKACP